MFQRKGFTIIELLIVIAVISILVGIALPRFRGMQEEGFIAQAKGELRTLQSAQESLFIHTGDYTEDLDDFITASPLIVGVLPTDPFTAATNYVSDVSPDGRYYVIYSVGPGGNGTASIADTAVITEVNGTSCIYVSNAQRDTTP